MDWAERHIAFRILVGPFRAFGIVILWLLMVSMVYIEGVQHSIKNPKPKSKYVPDPWLVEYRKKKKAAQPSLVNRLWTKLCLKLKI